MIENVELISQVALILYDHLSEVSAVISIAGAIISIRQFFKIKKYRKEIINDLRKTTMHKACDLLKKAQADCRKLLSNYRGQNNGEIYDAIQESIDLAIGELNQEASDSDVINQIQESSKELKGIRENGESANNLHGLLGNAIIQCNQIIGKIR